MTAVAARAEVEVPLHVEAHVEAQVEALDRAAPQDGRAATLDPALAGHLGVGPGDVVVVRAGGGRAAALRLHPAAPEDEGRGAVRLDALTRRSLGLRLGTDAVLSGGPVVPAADVELATAAPVLPARLAEVLAGVPLAAGSALALPVGPHGSAVVVRVVSTDPPGAPVTVVPTSRVRAEAVDLTELTHPVNGGLADVGGLDDAVAELREVVQLAVTRPEVLTRLGISPARGVVLHGPPGSGKTLLCRSLAGELDAAFYFVSGPEVVGSLHGQTEEGLRAVFADAADHAPAIICIDEVEALTRDRRALSSHADLRAVAQLLALMDGLRRAPGVFVVGTTNRVELVDEAFRRPGRFDHEIEVGLPDERARLEILRVQTRSMPLSAQAREALPALAAGTTGHTGADLAALAQRAGLVALRRLTDAGGLRTVTDRLAADDAVTVADLDRARTLVGPAGARDAHVRTGDPVPLAGRLPALDRLERLAAVAMGSPGTPPPSGSGILLTGRSGAGKTATATALAHRLGLRLLVVDGPELTSRWSGDTEQAVRGLARTALRLRPCLVLLDHLDTMAPRGAGTGGGDLRAAGQLAVVLAELTAAPGVVVVGATSRPELVDDALRGATGLRLTVEVPLPDDEDRAAILAARLAAAGRTLPAADLAELSLAGEWLTPADLVLAVELAVRAPRDDRPLTALIDEELAALVRPRETTR